MGTYGTATGLVIVRPAYNQPGKLLGLNAGEIQAYFDSDGAIKWAGGKGIADATGISHTEDASNYWKVAPLGGYFMEISTDGGDIATGIRVTTKFTGIEAISSDTVGLEGSGPVVGVKGYSQTAGGVGVLAGVYALATTALRIDGGIVDGGSQRYTNLADATAATDALNRQTGDARYIGLPGSPEQGDVLYYNGSAWARLVHGTAGDALISGGHGANPAWGDHDNLGGLGDDDHTQYLLATGTRTGASSQAQTLTYGVCLTAGDIDSNLGVQEYYGPLLIPGSYRHKISTSHSGTPSANKWELALCDGGAATFVDVLKFAGTTATFGGPVYASTLTAMDGTILYRGNAASIGVLGFVGSDTSYHYPYQGFYRARGTVDAPTDISANDYLGALNFYGYKNSGYRVAGGISVIAETIGASSVDGSLYLWIMKSGTGYTPLTLSPASNVLIGDTSANTSTVQQLLTLSVNSTGTAAAGFGSRTLWRLESSTTDDQSAAALDVVWYEATHASRKADLVLSAYDTAVREGLRIRGAGSAAAIGFLGATPVAQQLATTDLGLALSNLGLRAAGTAYPITTSGTCTLSGQVYTTAMSDYDTLPLVDSGAAGSNYIGGFYDLVAAKATLTIGGTVTQTYGTALNAKAARALCVVSGASAGATVLTVSGVSIDDSGTRNDADSEVLIADCSAVSANAFFQTTKKWLGRITYTLSGGSAGNALSFNYGFVRAKSNANTNFTLKNMIFFALGGATDTGINCELLHHKTTGWTYSAAAFTYPTANRIIMLSTDYGTNTRIASGVYINWRRTNLATAIAGATGGEGYLVRITTTVNNAIRWGYCRMGFATTA